MNNKIFRQLEEKLLCANAENISEVSHSIANDFREFGSSGRAHSKAEVVEYLKLSRDAQWQIENFEVKELATTVALVTYRIMETKPSGETKISMRSSIWRQRDESWLLVFHQGTRVEK